MSQSTTSTGNDTGATAKAETAAHEASAVTATAGEAARSVIQTGTQEAAAVAGEAKARVGDLLSQSGKELSDQAATQQRRLADGLGSVGQDLSRMADADESGGLAGDLVRRVAGHASTIGSWLGERDPQQLVQEVTSFARRRPGTFIAVAAIAGVVVGRLSRAIAAGAASGTTTPSGSSTPDGPRFAAADAEARASEAVPPAIGGDAEAGSFPAPPIPGEPVVPRVGAVAAPGAHIDDTGLVSGSDGGDPPLYTESAARIDGAREGDAHDRRDTL
ncbi:ElaB/YqjD/DUF883 family membrane-anchored ribosome-binding protein [Microbacterium sp. 1154]|uniref:hypothetical protein n=1 Tax=Microbacterium sp. 1154 TaxID=2817733 RepID=UPI00285BFA2C|nr:hypothetical protein [Microbacterium sp. 1154]MDR6691660.1 ElaB/YqjD/DUF883 family membrane-anchored ribosome-binding protein [Microbacterium sp. 1154]